MLQNEWQLNILDRLYQIIFEMIILSRIGTDRYRNRIFEILLLSLLGELWRDTKLHRFLAKNQRFELKKKKTVKKGLKKLTFKVNFL